MIQYIDLIQISSVLPVLICMYVLLCLFLCNFVTCEDQCIHNHSQDTVQFHQHKDFLCCLFIIILTFPIPVPPPSLKPWKPLLYSSFIKFQKYYINHVNEIIKYVTSWDCFFIQYNSLKIHPSCYRYNSVFFIISEQNYKGWIYYNLKNIWVVSSLGLIRIKLL